MNLLPIPWMKQKLEIIYDYTLYGNLYIMNPNPNFISNINNNYKALLDLLEDINIYIDKNNPLYLYFPINLNYFIKDLILCFKSLYKDNVYIILGGYKKDYPDIDNSDILIDLYNKFPDLNKKIDYCYLIDDSKCYKIFTSLNDTQRVCIHPNSSCTISGITLNYHIKKSNPSNTNHIAFVDFMNSSLSENIECYLMGLTDNNNNFNYNL